MSEDVSWKEAKTVEEWMRGALQSRNAEQLKLVLKVMDILKATPDTLKKYEDLLIKINEENDQTSTQDL